MTLAAGIAKASASTSGLAVSSSGIAFDDITLALTPGIAWLCVTEVAAGGKKITISINGAFCSSLKFFVHLYLYV